MTKKFEREKIRIVTQRLGNLFPYVKIQLDFRTPFELLVATILSAQCTDDRVNQVTKVIFEKYNKPSDFVNLELDLIEKLIFSTGYYKAKAKHIKEASTTIIEKFNNEVPGTMEELLSLSGVGRKTANVILGHIWNIPAIVVDTHVIRIINKLGFADTTNPEKIEFILMELLPKDKWVIFTHYMINFGRKICVARKPKCLECVLSDICPSANVDILK